ncbi:response regulator [Sinosporangium siamense]|uniref:Transcriptional regulatory protein n=1 Tax=Sinosporangium siamense TaxID=1367973 RepID=A0A919VAP1_9ACTN|nr:response regulator [Sinosporangium siamense]GII96676.1 transcriptional regulatory protein [Sinosporangium siamense]
MIEVLVVDDDFMVARVNRGFVNTVGGFRVVGMAHTGEQAIAAVAEHRPDLVLLDLYLPDMFGLDVITRLRADGHDCDVLVISAAREIEAVRGAARQGVVGYLLKPFDAADLRVRLEQYAAQHGAPGKPLVSGQAEIDRYLARARTSTGTVMLPKGMSVETAELVENALRAAGGTLSAAECAAEVGISRVSARRYLEHFVTTGRAAVTLKYGSAGRPERRYGWAT